jgi:hypothetical protein
MKVVRLLALCTGREDEGHEVFTKPSYLSTKLQVDISKNTIILILHKFFKRAARLAVAVISADVGTFW